MKRVFVFGVFNVLHPGHIRLFRFAKECGDELTVVVQSDEVSNNKAIYVKEDLRLEVIQSNSYVDHSFLSSDTIEELVKKNKPDIVVKGREYENRKNHEYEIIKSYGGELLFDSGGIIFSSLELLKNEAKNEIENI